MPRISKEERLARVYEEARHLFDEAESIAREERDQALGDRRFCIIPGSQWEGDLREQFENKPRFEINKTRRSVDRIVDEYRNNRIGVSFESKDGTPDDKLADACAALHRADEQDSTAEEAYDNAFDEGVMGGMGAWRVGARWENDRNKHEGDAEDRPQRIRFEPITDSDSCVFFDPNSKRQDKSDAMFCFVLTSMTRHAYQKKYKDDPASWPKSVDQSRFDWTPGDKVIIAEYYVHETVSETIHTFRGLDGDEVEHSDEDLESDEEGGSDLARELAATGYTEIGQRVTELDQVHKYILNGAKVLEDCGRIAGQEIPIVVFFGKRAFVDGKERFMGHVRLAKDAQRILNMVLSKLAEICGMSSVEKPIFTPEQMAGHESMWAADNIKNFPYLLVNPITDASGQQVASGPVGTTKSPDVPAVLAALAQLADNALKDILGNPQEAEKMVSHVAGKVVEILQQVLDKHAYIYVSNFSKAIRRSGQIWLSMGQEIYTTAGRKMKGISRLGKLTQVELMRPVIDETTGKPTTENDLSRAALDVTVNLGPSTSTKRQATVATATALLPVTDDPDMKAVLSSVAVANMEGEGTEGVRQFARMKLVRLGAEKPTPEESKQLAAEAQSQQPTAADQYALAAADEAKARAQQALADSAYKAAQTDKTKADTIATLADVDLAHRKAGIDAVESLHGMINTPAPAPSPGQPPGLGSSQQ